MWNYFNIVITSVAFGRTTRNVRILSRGHMLREIKLKFPLRGDQGITPDPHRCFYNFHRQTRVRQTKPQNWGFVWIIQKGCIFIWSQYQFVVVRRKAKWSRIRSLKCQKGEYSYFGRSIYPRSTPKIKQPARRTEIDTIYIIFYPFFRARLALHVAFLFFWAIFILKEK